MDLPTYFTCLNLKQRYFTVLHVIAARYYKEKRVFEFILGKVELLLG